MDENIFFNLIFEVQSVENKGGFVGGRDVRADIMSNCNEVVFLNSTHRILVNRTTKGK